MRLDVPGEVILPVSPRLVSHVVPVKEYAPTALREADRGYVVWLARVNA